VFVPSIDQPVLCPILVGRDEPLRKLDHLLHATVGPRTVLLSGEAGIGKTRLLAELAHHAHASTHLVARAAAYESGRNTPFGLVFDLLRNLLSGPSREMLLHALAPFVDDLVLLIPALVGYVPQAPDSHVSIDRQPAPSMLIPVVDRLAGLGPLVLFLEDLHWADEASLELVAHFARAVQTSDSMVVGTFRPHESGSHVRQLSATLERERLAIDIALTPLTDSDVARMVRATLETQPIRLSHGMLERVHRLAEGNPFFVEEILRTVLASADGATAPGLGIGVPRTVHDAVQQRIERLPADARRTASLAAVVGRQFELQTLQRLLQWDDDRLLLAIRELTRADVLVEHESTGRFGFRHELARQAIYADLLGEQRRRLHAQLTDLLELEGAQDSGTVQLDELAYHAFAAHDWQRCQVYATQACERAIAMLAPRAALEYAAQAQHAAAALDAPVPVVLYSVRGRAYEILGDFDEASAEYERALHTDDPVHRATTFMDLALLWSARSYERAGSYAGQAVDAARAAGDPLLLARSLNRLGNWHMNVGGVRAAIALHEEALTLAAGGDAAQEVRETLDLLGMTTNLLDPVAAAAYYAQLLPLVRAAADRRALATDLVMHANQGGFYANDTFVVSPMDAEQSARDLAEAVRIAREIPWPAGEAFTLWESAAWCGFRGQFGRALAHGRQALDVAEQISHSQWIVGALWATGTTYLNLFLPEQALPLLERGLALATDLASDMWRPLIGSVVVQAQLQRGHLADAHAVLADVLAPDAPVDIMGPRLAWAARIEVALAQRDSALALQILDRVQSTVRIGQVVPRLALLRAQAFMLIQKFADADVLLRDAEATAASLGARPLLLQLHAAHTRLLRLANRRDAAAVHLAAAHQVIDALRSEIDEVALASVFAQRAEALLPRQGGVSQRRLAKAAAGGLTSRERDVARLIARGASNRAIAEALVLGERTIEGHVSSILNKLAFGSRAQIAAWAASHLAD
jgi:DNA-binding NarL/FixJ family response regulator